MAETIHHPLGFCSSCGPFPAKGFAFGLNVNATLIDCGTNCPTCDGGAEIIPGTYSTAGDRLNLLVDKSISREALTALRRLAEQAQAGHITPEQARQEAEEVAPGTGKLFDVRDWSDQAKATLYASIIGATAVVAAAAISSQQRVVVEQAVESVIKRHQSGTELANRPSDEPPPPQRKPKSPR